VALGMQVEAQMESGLASDVKASTSNDEMRDLLESHEARLKCYLDEWRAQQDGTIKRLIAQQERCEDKISQYFLMPEFGSKNSESPRSGRKSPQRRAISPASKTTGNQVSAQRSTGSANAGKSRYKKKGITLSSLFEEGPTRLSRDMGNSSVVLRGPSYQQRITKSLNNVDLTQLRHENSRRGMLLKPAISMVRFTQSIVRTTYFDLFSGVIILINAVCVGLETEWMTSNEGNTSSEYTLCALLLNSWFIMELMLRIIADGLLFFLNDEWKWNCFDTLLVFTAIVDLCFSMLAIGAWQKQMSRVFRIVRLFRIVRTLKIVRLLRFITEFRKMVYALAASVQNLVWSLLFLFCVIYFYAIWITQGVTYVLYNSEGPVHPELYASYGTVGRSMHSLYMAITNGMSWGLLFDPLASADGMLAFLFISYVSICSLGVLNVVTSVFVESAMQSTLHHKDLLVADKARAKETYLQHVKDIFKQMDTDGSGSIDAGELKKFMQDESLELSSYFEALELNPSDTHALFKLLDPMDMGEINIDDFCDGCVKLKGEAKSFDVHSMWYEMKRNMAKMAKAIDESTQQAQSTKRNVTDVSQTLNDLKAFCVQLSLGKECTSQAKYSCPPPTEVRSKDLPVTTTPIPCPAPVEVGDTSIDMPPTLPFGDRPLSSHTLLSEELFIVRNQCPRKLPLTPKV